MKQTINESQWEELNGEEKSILIEHFPLANRVIVFGNGGITSVDYVELNIGQMIEFLGDEYGEALLVSYHIADDGFVPTNEVCDVLWKAVKYKLKHETNNQ